MTSKWFELSATIKADNKRDAWDLLEDFLDGALHGDNELQDLFEIKELADEDSSVSSNNQRKSVGYSSEEMAQHFECRECQTTAKWDSVKHVYYCSNLKCKYGRKPEEEASP